MKHLLPTMTALTMTILLLSGCDEELPSRDHIPLLKHQVYRLQEAVKTQNRAAIDSLLSPEVFDYGQNSDSLLSFVYGPQGTFAFEHFADCDIAYTSDKARVDCYIMDSTSESDRPVVFTFVYRHDLWLVKRFEVGRPQSDST